MGFMTDEELDDYLVLILLMVKKKKAFLPKKSKRF